MTAVLLLNQDNFNVILLGSRPVGSQITKKVKHNIVFSFSNPWVWTV